MVEPDSPAAAAHHHKAGTMAMAVPALNNGNTEAACRNDGSDGGSRNDGDGGGVDLDGGDGGGNDDHHASSPSPQRRFNGGADTPRRGGPPSVAAALHALDGQVSAARRALAEVDRAVAGMRAALYAEEGGRKGGGRGEELSVFQ